MLQREDEWHHTPVAPPSTANLKLEAFNLILMSGELKVTQLGMDKSKEAGSVSAQEANTLECAIRAEVDLDAAHSRQ